MVSCRPIGLVGRVIANHPGEQNSIPDQVIPKIQKMLNTQHYKVGIKGKMDQSKVRSSTLSYTSA